MATTTFKKGDPVQITFADDRAPGEVILAAPNGRALMVNFEAILGGWVGIMAIYRNDDGSYADVLTGRPVSLTARAI